MAVIIDKTADSEILENLEKLNIKYYKSTSLDFLYSPVNTHPDMQIHFISDTMAVAAPSAFDYYKRILPCSITLYKGAMDPGRTYPYTCAYNIAKLGKKVIGNLSYTDAFIKNIYEKARFEFINVKQGYTKCNLCIVDANSAITEDEGIYKALSYKMDILKVPTGEISLTGFKHGFIGGASGFIAHKKLAFCGDVSKLSYFSDLKKFLEERDIEIISLSNRNLMDLGSILYFKDCPV